MFHEDLGEHVLIKTASQVALVVKNRLPMQETQVRFLGGEDALEEEMATTPVSLPGKSMDRGAWGDAVHRVTEGQT